MTIAKICSGAQTGADRGALDASIWCKLPYDGWCPKGRLAENGTIPARYVLKEMPTKDYLARTKANVVDSDATLIFSYGDLEGGSLRTAEFATKFKKPWLHIDLGKMDRKQAVDAVAEWLKDKCPEKCVLNVAGSRESKSPGIMGVVKARMIDIISKVNGTLFYPIADDAPSDDDDITPVATPDVPKEASRSTETSVSLYHPKTIEDAVGILLKVLNPETQDRIRGSADRWGFILESHFGMGMWVRNALIHGNRNIVDLYADFQRGCREGKWEGIAEPDSVSGEIVGLVWDALHGKAG